MKVVSCKIPERLAAKLKGVAKAERRSQQALLREALERRLKSKTTRPSSSAYELIKHLVGTLEGPSDLATNPKYMSGFGE